MTCSAGRPNGESLPRSEKLPVTGTLEGTDFSQSAYRRRVWEIIESHLGIPSRLTELWKNSSAAIASKFEKRAMRCSYRSRYPPGYGRLKMLPMGFYAASVSFFFFFALRAVAPERFIATSEHGSNTLPSLSRRGRPFSHVMDRAAGAVRIRLKVLLSCPKTHLSSTL